MKFHVADFTGSFHAIFVRCKALGLQLHPEFLPLGLMLGSMYDHLEGLDVEVDVGECYARASADADEETTHG